MSYIELSFAAQYQARLLWQGRFACRATIASTTCPYAADSYEAGYWLIGWHDAHRWHEYNAPVS